MAPMWDRIDPLAEKYYGISPYAYCGGDPVNRGDYDGKKVVFQDRSGAMEKQFIQAMEYLDQVGEYNFLRKIYESDNYSVTICKNKPNGYDNYKEKHKQDPNAPVNKGIIYWDPTEALETNTGYVMSPAEGLNHEAFHAHNDLKDALNPDPKKNSHKANRDRVSNTEDKKHNYTDEKWKNQEEYNACQNDNMVARMLRGLPASVNVRTKYIFEKITYRVNSVTSNSKN